MKIQTFVCLIVWANTTLTPTILNRSFLLLLTKFTRIFGCAFLAPPTEFSVFLIPMKLLRWLDRVAFTTLLLPVHFLLAVKRVTLQAERASVKRLSIDVTGKLPTTLLTDFCFLHMNNYQWRMVKWSKYDTIRTTAAKAEWSHYLSEWHLWRDWWPRVVSEAQAWACPYNDTMQAVRHHPLSGLKRIRMAIQWFLLHSQAATPPRAAQIASSLLPARIFIRVCNNAL